MKAGVPSWKSASRTSREDDLCFEFGPFANQLPAYEGMNLNTAKTLGFDLPASVLRGRLFDRLVGNLAMCRTFISRGLVHCLAQISKKDVFPPVRLLNFQQCNVDLLPQTAVVA